MATNIPLNLVFYWGDNVSVRQSAPKMFRPGSVGVICGIRLVDTEDLMKIFGQKLNSEVYLVEFGDGESIEIPTRFLQPFKS